NYLAPFAVGAILTAMVYMGFAISGAHFNPATTLAVLILKKISLKDSIFYFLVQLLGAFAASYFMFLIWGRSINAPKPTPDLNILKSLALESIFTFALVLVCLAVTLPEKNKGNNYYGLAIGFTVMAIAFAGGPISGGAFNPALGSGSILVDSIFGDCPCHPIQNLWIYLAGPFSGSVVAAFGFRYIFGE
ncbi:MAG TPA: aquaporin, partial [Bacteroidia bacterium]